MELTLARQAGSQVLVTCDGQLSHTFDIRTLAPGEQGPPQPLDDPVAYGKAVYQALFPLESAARRELDTLPERILLVSSDDTLETIAWEYAYGQYGAEDVGNFLVLSCHVVRGLPLDQRIAPPALENGLQIVAIPSNPLDKDLPPLDITAEWIRLQEIIHEVPATISLERVRPPTIEQTRRLVANQRNRIVHFMGHGGQHQTGAILCFEKDNGELHLVTAREFVMRVRGSVFLVTLNACVSATPGPTNFSNLAAALVRQKTPYALGMRLSIHDDDARTFSRTFYSELASGVSVEEALFQARLTLAHSPRSWVIGVPVLYTALTAPAAGFTPSEGIATVNEHQPPIEVSVLPRAEGAFQGRIDELKQLGDYLTGDNRPRVVTIHGSGGQGKTALAREAVERFAYAWPGGVWATTLESLPGREVFVSDLARFLGIATQEINDPAEIERQVLRQLNQHRTLLVLDNFETLIIAIEANHVEALQLVQLIQQLPSSFVSLLVTSREHLGWSGEVALEIGGLSLEEGANLFEQSAPQRANELDQTLVWELSEKVEGHPLSLRLLGGAFNAIAVTFPVFVKEYEVYLLHAEDKYKDVDHRQRTLYASIETSVRYLDAELRTLLSGLWVFRAQFLPEAAVLIFDSEEGDTEHNLSPVRNQLHTLWQRGLLTYYTVSVNEGILQFYHLLPTTRPYVEHYLEQMYEHDYLLAQFGGVYSRLASFLNDELDRSAAASVVAQRAREDLERGAKYVTGIQQGYYLLYLARILHRLGDPKGGLKLLELALEIAQGQNQALEFQILNMMAGIFQTMGEPNLALQFYEKMLPLIREAEDRGGESTILHNKARTYQYMGEKRRAIELYKEALAIRRELGNRAKVAATLDNMAGAYQEIGETQQAIQLYNEAIYLMREVGDRAGEAATLNGIASLLRDIGQYPDALAFFKQSIVLEQQISHRAGEAAGLVEIALVLYRYLNRTEDAISYIEQAIAVLMQTDLPQDAAGRTLERLQLILQAMRTGATF